MCCKHGGWESIIYQTRIDLKSSPPDFYGYELRSVIRKCQGHEKESCLSPQDGKKLAMQMEKSISSTTVRGKRRGLIPATGRQIGLQGGRCFTGIARYSGSPVVVQWCSVVFW